MEPRKTISDQKWQILTNIFINPNISSPQKMAALKPYINHARESDGETWLSVACRANNELFVVQLLRHEADVQQKNGEGHTPLFIAASCSSLAIVRRLVQAGARVNVLSVLDSSPLAAVATRGEIESVRFLLDSGADPNLAGENGFSPIYVAAAKGFNSIIRLLKKRGAEINGILSSTQDTTLLVAADYSHLSTISILLELGADPRLTNEKNQSPLILLVMRLKQRWDDEVKVALTALMRANTDIYHADLTGETALIYVMANDNQPLFNFLLSYIPQPRLDEKAHRQTTLLRRACEDPNIFYAKTLLTRGADPLITDGNETCALHVAVYVENIALVKLLISHFKQKKISVDQKDNPGHTPLHHAAEKGNLKLVTLLQEAGADVNNCGHDGSTPIFMASQEGHYRVVEYLLRQGADMEIARKDGTSCVFIAHKYNHQATIQTLLAHYFKHGLKLECFNFSNILDSAIPKTEKQLVLYMPIGTFYPIPEKKEQDPVAETSTVTPVAAFQTAFSYLRRNGFSKEEIQAMKRANKIEEEEEVVSDALLEQAAPKEFTWFDGLLSTTMPEVRAIESMLTKTPNCYLYIDYKNIAQQGCTDARQFDHIPLKFCARKGESGIKYLSNLATVVLDIQGETKEIIITDELKFSKHAFRVYAVRQRADGGQQATLIVAILYDKKGLHKDRTAAQLQLKTKTLKMHFPDSQHTSPAPKPSEAPGAGQ